MTRIYRIDADKKWVSAALVGVVGVGCGCRRGTGVAPEPDAAQGEEGDGDPEGVDGHGGHGGVVEGVDQHEDAAGEVEHLVGHPVPGQPAHRDEDVGQQEGGRA